MIILLSATKQIKLKASLQRNSGFNSSDFNCLGKSGST